MIVNKLQQIINIKELRNNILFVLGILVIFRFAAHVPIPGVNTANLREFFGSNQVLGLLNMFSGGVMENFSIVMMGIAPYITSSIIFQLLGMIVPKMEEMQKEEQGRQKINTWTRWATVPFAAIQAFGMITILQKSQYDILGDIGAFDMFVMIVTITAGTVFLMWLGELITEKKIGNGISILIFAGIISSLPQVIQQTIATYDPSKLFTIVGFLALAVATIAGVIYVTEGQRNIPVQYARQVRAGRTYGGENTHLPLRVNMAGVIPIIFAISIIIFPSMIAQFFINAQTPWVASVAQWVIELFQKDLFYGVVYFVLVFGFTFFYTEVVFHPDRIAENLQKQGGFIPGIRPGNETSEYLSRISHRVVLVGALFLSFIAVMPLIVRYFSGAQFLVIGGTSLLIVVSVVIDIVKQIEAQLTMREYDNIK
ncbi:preprotein translocase subunit SecY [Patescibacteria group bacterium]|nr:preprotein translocase subunit SecY [Patescibacteria group bacterium]